MKKFTSQEIRQLWKDFWESKGVDHKWLEPASLVPDSKDKTVLFTTAGMQQLVPYLVGKPHPLGNRVYNIQKCLRTGDIDEVGDERHLTCFEMMGNWSLGDYFKKEAISWSYEFLTKYLEVPHDKIGATVFIGEGNIPQDQESIGYWQGHGVPMEKIRKLSAKDNFRGPAGEVGPCGPCSEMYVDRGDDYGPADWNIGDNDRYIEVWNDVFMEFYKNDKGEYEKLQQQNVDTGMGLERIAMIMQGKETVFETDIFEPVISAIQDFTGVQYPPYLKKEKEFADAEKQITKSFRIITDHMRASSFLIGDGVIPSNEGRGYVLRRLIRRAYYNLKSLKKDVDVKGFVDKLVDNITIKYGEHRKELSINKDSIKQAILKEFDQFDKTLDRGEKEFEKLSQNLSKNTKLTGQQAFLLYDTYGLPIDVINEMAAQRGFGNDVVDISAFEAEMGKAREKSREGSKEMFKRGIDWAKYLDGVSQTEFVGYDNLSGEAKLLKEIDIEGKKVLVFDKTPFYAESGGQKGDNGFVVLDDGRELEIVDVQKYAGVFLHFVK